MFLLGAAAVWNKSSFSAFVFTRKKSIRVLHFTIGVINRKCHRENVVLKKIYLTLKAILKHLVIWANQSENPTTYSEMKHKNEHNVWPHY